jgi:hypothetical protein
MSRQKILVAISLFLAAFFFAEAENKIRVFSKIDQLLPATEQSLVNIYRTGKVHFIPKTILEGSSLPKDVLFVNPIDVVADIKGNIFILDISDNNIKKFNPSGKFLKVIGRKGQGPGEFNMPSDLVLARDCLAVLDMGNQRLSTLTLDGEPIKSGGLSSFAAMPRKIKALPNGDLIVETEKSHYEDFNKPQDCALEIVSPDLRSKKVIYSHQANRYKYIRFQQAVTNAIQPFSPDVYWDASPDGKIVIGFSDRYEISIYDAEGLRLTTLTHSYDPAKVTENDKKSFFDATTLISPDGTMQGPPDIIVKNTKFPRIKPAFNDIMTDSDGNIWVHSYGKDTEKEDKHFDVFDSQGKFINRIEILGESYYPYRAKMIGGYLWKIETDKEGFFKVIKYRITG